LIQLPMNTSIARLSSPGNAAPTMPLANLAHGLSLLVVESVTPGSRVLVCSVEVVASCARRGRLCRRPGSGPVWSGGCGEVPSELGAVEEDVVLTDKAIAHTSSIHAVHGKGTVGARAVHDPAAEADVAFHGVLWHVET
jgi:hypothetical protein